MNYNKEDFTVDSEDEEWITNCIVDPLKKKFYLQSNEGNEKVVECSNVDEFMNVLEMVRAVMPEKIISYSNPF